MIFKRKSLKSLEMWRFGVRTGAFFRRLRPVSPARGAAAGTHGKRRSGAQRTPPLQETKTDIRLSLLLPHLGESLAAVHGAVRLGLEGHAGLAAAGSADSG